MLKAETVKRPLVGMGVIIRKEGKVLLSRRKNSHGEGTWCFPGGHLEFNEELSECALREVKEETGLDVKYVGFLTATNDIMENEGKHYITLYVVSGYVAGEPRTAEPDKSGEWIWFEWGKLPKPLFIPMQDLLKQGLDPFRL